MISTWMTNVAPFALSPRPLVEDVGPAPETPLHSSKVDAAGNPRLVSDRIQLVKAYDTGSSRFRRPDRHYSGYGADGFWYTDGELDPGHPRPEASWALEAAGPHRGDAASFPRRIIVVATREELCIINASNYEVWMRFLAGGSLGTALGPVGWTSTVQDFDFIDGILVLGTPRGVLTLDFGFDVVYWTLPGGLLYWQGMTNRNDPTYRGSVVYDGPVPDFQGTGTPLTGENKGYLWLRTYKVSAMRVARNYGEDAYEPTFILSSSNGIVVLRARSKTDGQPNYLHSNTEARQPPFGLQTGFEDRGEDYFPPPGVPWMEFLYQPVQGDQVPVDLRDHFNVGDKIVTQDLWTQRVVAVQETYLEVHNAAPFGFSDDYEVHEPLMGIGFPTSGLALSSALGFAWTQDPSWLEDPAAALNEVTVRAWPAGMVTNVRDMVHWPEENTVFVATDGGVMQFRIEEGAVGEAAYGAGESYLYPILPGNDVMALAWDASARTLGVAVRDGDFTNIVEVDLARKTVLKTTRVRGHVTRLATTPREV